MAIECAYDHPMVLECAFNHLMMIEYTCDHLMVIENCHSCPKMTKLNYNYMVLKKNTLVSFPYYLFSPFDILFLVTYL